MFWIPTILAASLLGNKIHAQGTTGNYTELNIQPDGEWTPFYFGRVGQPPFNLVRFAIGLMTSAQAQEDGTMSASNHPDGHDHHGMRRCYLEVTDAFCPGDRFEVIKLGTGGLAPTSILNTTVVEYNHQVARDICDGFPVQCAHSTTNPDVAFNDDLWSSGRVLMSAGNHSVLIKPTNSPYCSGAGFVRIHCTHPPIPPHPPVPPMPELMCKYSEGGFRMVMQPVQGPAAGAVCTTMGMKLAEVSNANFVASTNVAFKCSGPLSTSWIGAWNGQSWSGQEGLGLTVSTASPGGSINVYNDGKARKVLCQEL